MGVGLESVRPVVMIPHKGAQHAIVGTARGRRVRFGIYIDTARLVVCVKRGWFG